MPLHVNITDPDLHEPKGVASADAKTVYKADGAGSGSWQPVRFFVGGKLVFTAPNTAEGVTYETYIPIKSKVVSIKVRKIVTDFTGSVTINIYKNDSLIATGSISNNPNLDNNTTITLSANNTFEIGDSFKIHMPYSNLSKVMMFGCYFEEVA